MLREAPMNKKLLDYCMIGLMLSMPCQALAVDAMGYPSDSIQHYGTEVFNSEIFDTEYSDFDPNTLPATNAGYPYYDNATPKGYNTYQGYPYRLKAYEQKIKKQSSPYVTDNPYKP